jgi:hypothetical protein
MVDCCRTYLLFVGRRGEGGWDVRTRMAEVRGRGEVGGGVCGYGWKRCVCQGGTLSSFLESNFSNTLVPHISEAAGRRRAAEEQREQEGQEGVMG